MSGFHEEKKAQGVGGVRFLEEARIFQGLVHIGSNFLSTLLANVTKMRPYEGKG